jgi:hypothetical protein
MSGPTPGQPVPPVWLRAVADEFESAANITLPLGASPSMASLWHKMAAELRLVAAKREANQA